MKSASAGKLLSGACRASSGGAGERGDRPTGHDGQVHGVTRSGLRVTPALTIPDGELSWRFSHSSGPGGQGVNTADSRVELSWDVDSTAVLSDTQRDRLTDRLGNRLVSGVLTVVASEHRAQLRNREAARARLAALVADAVAPPARQRRAM